MPAPLIAEKDYFLKGDGTWGEIVIPTDYVTLGTSQVITGEKTFRGSKRIKFKQGSASDKLGFTLYDNNNRERAFLEYASQQLINDTPTLLLGNYSTNANQITYIGFRNFVNGSGLSGAYNLLAPLISDASVPFELSTTYTNFYMMLGAKYGNNIVKTGADGVLDLNSILPEISENIDDELLSNVVTLDGNETITGIKIFDKNTFNSIVELTGSTIDVSTASCFQKTVTSDIELTFTGVPSGKFGTFTLILINGGAFDVTFPNNIVWSSNSGEPTLKTSGTDVLTFFTIDGGTTWNYSGDSTNVYQGPTSNSDGIAGMVPPARYGQKDYFLRGDGVWSYITDGGVITDFVGATASSNGTHGMVPAPYSSEANAFLKGDGTWQTITTYQGATSTTNGIEGLVPRAMIADKDKFLKGDGTWQELSDMVTLATAQTITGTKTFEDVYNTVENVNATSGEVYIDGSSSVYTLSISTHTDIAFTAPITSGKAKVFTLIIDNNPQSGYAVYWPMNVYWNSGIPPTLNGRTVITFLGIYNPNSNAIEYYGTPSVVEAATE